MGEEGAHHAQEYWKLPYSVVVTSLRCSISVETVYTARYSVEKTTIVHD